MAPLAVEKSCRRRRRRHHHHHQRSNVPICPCFFGMHQKFRAGPPQNFKKICQISLIKLVSWVRFFSPTSLVPSNFSPFFGGHFFPVNFCSRLSHRKAPTTTVTTTKLPRDLWTFYTRIGGSSVRVATLFRWNSRWGLWEVWKVGSLTNRCWQKGSMAQPLGCIGEFDVTPYESPPFWELRHLRTVTLVFLFLRSWRIETEGICWLTGQDGIKWCQMIFQP